MTTEEDAPPTFVPQISVRTNIKGGKGITTKLKTCVHYVSLPPGQDTPTPLTDPDTPARTWPFTLDEFQRHSVRILEQNEMLLVAAHTSAGKTAIGEYAVSKALQSNSRVIYTSPIKALSNQKFREMSEYYPEVGLMTGDVNINPNAPCLVMTTEILRNMMIHGSETMTSVSWIIFDEVHYMFNRERGVVWEESIIMIDPKINLVFLSATLANPSDFADWITMLKGRPCHVVNTDYRPTPLLHYVFTNGGDGLYLVVDDKGNFRGENFAEAAAVQNTDSDGKGNTDLYRIVSLAEENTWLPLIVFSFSRKECEFRAISLKKIDLNTVEEKAAVKEVFDNAIHQLAEEDRDLPQLKLALPLMLRGIGVHHSGLLPILKEVVEILFQESLIKVLFATETFAIGVNMPAKTCVFSSTQKFDGQNFRNLKSSEYTQMSGRAGRRGQDKHGICIIMIDDGVEMEDIRQIITGGADPLASQFKLGYTLILNTLRAESAMSTEELIKRSLHQYMYEKEAPDNSKQLEELNQLSSQAHDQDLENFVVMTTLLQQLMGNLRSEMQKPAICLPYMQPGRCVYIKNEHEEYGWGVVLNFRKKFAPDVYVIHVLLPLLKLDKHGTTGVPVPCKLEELQQLKDAGGFLALAYERGMENLPQMHVVACDTSMLWTISAVRLYMPHDLRGIDTKMQLYDCLIETANNFPLKELPALSPEDMGLLNPGNEKEIGRIKSLRVRIAQHKANKIPAAKREAFSELFRRRAELQDKIQGFKQKDKRSHIDIFKTELSKRSRVLRRLGHIDDQGVQLAKGKVACEIESVDELLVTEMIFDGVFNDLDPAQSTAVLTCLFPQDKTKMAVKVSEELMKAFDRVKQLALRVSTVEKECGLEVEPEQYAETFKTNMMQLTYEWCSGKSFPEICMLTDMFEGSIIRNLRRLEELMRELAEAAASIGNAQLQEKFNEGSKGLKRGIVFAGSLYTE